MAETRLLNELRRRHVFRVAIAYAVTAWLLLQLAAIVLPAFGAPHWVLKVLIGVFVLLFPIAILLAWAFEVTPEGVRRTESEEAEAARPAGYRRRVGRVLNMGIIVVLAAAVGLLAWRQFGPASKLRASRVAVTASAGAPATAVDPARGSAIPAKSIAVLPFADNSSQSNQRYFSDGLSESLIIALSQYPALTVIGRESSFQLRNAKLDSMQIGKKLRVANLLEGSVSREGDEVRIRAELVSTADGRTLWSNQYDRPYKNLFALQDAITKAVATALKAKLLGSGKTGAVVQNDRPPSGSLAAYNDYLQGNFYTSSYIDAKNLRRGIAFYQKAIQEDPRYAAAYAGLSMAWSHLSGTALSEEARKQAYASAKAAADQALKLDPLSAAAHTAQGMVFEYTLHIRKSEAEFRRAVTLDPSDPTALRLLAFTMSNMGRARASLPVYKSAIHADPLNGLAYEDLSGAYDSMGKPKEALRALDRAIKLHPSAPDLHRWRAYFEVQRGNPEAALAAAKRETDPSQRQAALAYAYQAAGDHVRATQALTRLIAMDSSHPTAIADIYAYRGNSDKVFEWLERAWRQRDPALRQLLIYAFLRRYRNDPRYAALYRKLGLPVPDSAPATATAS